MMTQQKSEQENFHALLADLYSCIPRDGIAKVRSKAWEHYLELGLPSRKTEAFRYLNLRNLLNKNIAHPKPAEIDLDAIKSFIYPECSDSVLVFVNGSFQISLSRIQALPKKIVILPLSDAMRTYGAFLNNQWARSLKEETDPFAALNAAMHPNGAFIYMPPKTVVETPLQILHIVDSQNDHVFTNPRLNVFVGPQGQINLHTSQAIINGRSPLTNMVIDLAIEEEAHIKVTQTALLKSADAWHFEALRATLKRNSTLTTVSVNEGSASIRNDYRISLAGENAEALLNGLWMLSGKREAHTHVIMDHQAPLCRSLQLYKGVLNDFAHSSFEGKILVRQAAQKTEAFQLNNNLLLSDRAAADSKPNLEIFADDVKASHGATIGRLDAEQLFYMKTRGFSDAEAKSILTYGFCKEIFDKIKLPSLREKISLAADNYLKLG